MKIKDGFIVRQIAGKYMAIPVGSRTKELHGMIALNETAAFLWNKMEKDVTQDELISAVLNEYDVEQTEAEKFISDFIAELQKEGMLDV